MYTFQINVLIQELIENINLKNVIFFGIHYISNISNYWWMIE
jgi:hypothetical protein